MGRLQIFQTGIDSEVGAYMNYLRELNAFRDWALLNQPSTGQVALWYSLMSVNNMAGWVDWFTVPNQTLQLMTGLSRAGLDNARSDLKTKNLIEYRKGTSNQAGRYRMVSLAECQKVGTGVDTVVSTARDTALDEVRAQDYAQERRDTSTLFKQDKTKQDLLMSSAPAEDETAIENKMKLRTGNFQYRLVQNDYKAYRTLASEGVPLDFILAGIDESFETYEPKHAMDAISKFGYCAKRILTRWTEMNSRQSGGDNHGKHRTANGDIRPHSGANERQWEAAESRFFGRGP